MKLEERVPFQYVKDITNLHYARRTGAYRTQSLAWPGLYQSLTVGIFQVKQELYMPMAHRSPCFIVIRNIITIKKSGEWVQAT